ncbi:MAG TPA: PqqD family protein [Thermoanaerobaculia bacterium]|nr:PqqD family protein [Thermoanaerobaculia bacterium]
MLCRDLGGESVLLEPRVGRYFGLDEVGTRIWFLIAEHRRFEEVLGALAAEYEVPPDRLRADVAAFIEALRDHGLVEVHGG